MTADAGAEHSHLVTLTKGGPVIGAFHNCSYEQESVQLHSGDVLVAYTDGLTEALNPAGREFGEKGLRRIIVLSAHLPARELIDKVVTSVREWCGETPPHDDLTLVVMKVK